MGGGRQEGKRKKVLPLEKQEQAPRDAGAPCVEDALFMKTRGDKGGNVNMGGMPRDTRKRRFMFRMSLCYVGVRS